MKQERFILFDGFPLVVIGVPNDGGKPCRMNIKNVDINRFKWDECEDGVHKG